MVVLYLENGKYSKMHSLKILIFLFFFFNKRFFLSSSSNKNVIIYMSIFIPNSKVFFHNTQVVLSQRSIKNKIISIGFHPGSINYQSPQKSDYLKNLNLADFLITVFFKSLEMCTNQIKINFIEGSFGEREA